VNRRGHRTKPLNACWKRLNHKRSRVRTMGEHALHVVKRLWGFSVDTGSTPVLIRSGFANHLHQEGGLLADRLPDRQLGLTRGRRSCSLPEPPTLIRRATDSGAGAAALLRGTPSAPAPVIRGRGRASSCADLPSRKVLRPGSSLPNHTFPRCARPISRSREWWPMRKCIALVLAVLVGCSDNGNPFAAELRPEGAPRPS
jgi:hypothetical protein